MIAKFVNSNPLKNILRSIYEIERTFTESLILDSLRVSKLLANFYFWKGDWDFPKMSSFPKTLMS